MTNRFLFEFEDLEPEEIPLYPTKGVYITNVFTGKDTKYLVGSKDEDRFYKVIDVSISVYDSTPKKIMGPAQGSSTFFFSSPEDYESFYEKTIDENIKISWRQKRCLLESSKTQPTKKNQPSKPKMWMSKPKKRKNK